MANPFMVVESESAPMRAALPSAGLLLSLAALALGASAAATDSAGLDPPQVPLDTGTSTGLPGDAGGAGSGVQAPPSGAGGVGGGSGGLPSGPFDLGDALRPDLGAGIWFTIGIGAGLAGLAAASLLGTRFVNSENVLENDARRAIFEYIKANPGCHLRETAGALQLSTTNVLWHLRKLEESNLVNGKKLEGYKVFYPVEGGVEAKRMGLALAVLRNPNAAQVLGIIARSPGIHQREIARMLGVNHGTVRWHLKKLSLVQLVLEVKKGSISQYFVSALGLQALERVERRPAEQAQPPQPPPLVEAVVAASTQQPAEA
jgi:predicted transcriptional regulator